MPIILDFKHNAAREFRVVTQVWAPIWLKPS